MSTDITVPVFPESVTEGTLLTWHKRPGEPVTRGELLAEIETDKVVFEVPAPVDGTLTEITMPVGAVVKSGQVVGHLDQSAKAAPKPAPAVSETAPQAAIVMPAAKRMMEEHGLDARQIAGSGKGGRVLKEDVQQRLDINESVPAPVAVPPKPVSAPAKLVPTPTTAPAGERPEKRVPMTRLRARVAERLVEAQHTAAILTTFNEVNMQPVMELRTRHRERFEKEHGVRLGFMSFFVKAAVEALRHFPEVNASIDGSDIVYHGFYDIGIAVGTPRGLVVPVLRDADRLSMAEIETRIRDFGERAQNGRLTLEEITGGTFTITNGGVFGSLLSTPILNPPQAAILGMHKIQERPVAEKGQVVIRPVMYLALSYDHRLIDGREAVQFLVMIKELLEDPARLLLEI
ncbi:MAG: 2-oxoglutarate dehydrogenase complex dihydrolipoyllysine-residue succinyltransferase [Gammaproteobacteria bacterium]|nr:2-oxoglutarate dehydrogenase complex dihydrolipoyllysine-residue succinyltransferase [Gammaproteobacteria bacterium]